MDGLTNFIQLLMKRQANPSTPIHWQSFEDAYTQLGVASGVGGAGGSKAGGANPTKNVWEKIPLQTRRSGLIVAIAKTEKSKRGEFLTSLGIGIKQIKDIEDLLKFQKMFDFDAKNVLKDDAITELAYIETNYPDEFTKEYSLWAPMKSNLNNLVLPYSHMFQYLATSKYIQHEYDKCLVSGPKKETLKCMTETEEKNLLKCIPDTGLASFKQYILNKLFVDDENKNIDFEKIEQLAKEELTVRKKEKQLKELNSHTLVRNTLTLLEFDDFLIGYGQFWDKHAKAEMHFAIEEYLNHQKSSPGLLLLIRETESKDDEASILVKIAVNNLFYQYNGNMYDSYVYDVERALKEFKPILNIALQQTAIDTEIDTFLKFTKLTQKQKASLNKIKQGEYDSAREFPDLASSMFLIYNKERDAFRKKVILYANIYAFRQKYNPDSQGLEDKADFDIFQTKKLKVLKSLLHDYETNPQDHDDFATKYEEMLQKNYASKQEVENFQTKEFSSNYDTLFTIQQPNLQPIIETLEKLSALIQNTNCDNLDDLFEQIIVIKTAQLILEWKQSIIESATKFLKHITAGEMCPIQTVKTVTEFLHKLSNVPPASINLQEAIPPKVNAKLAKFTKLNEVKSNQQYRTLKSDEFIQLLTSFKTMYILRLACDSSKFQSGNEYDEKKLNALKNLLDKYNDALSTETEQELETQYRQILDVEFKQGVSNNDIEKLATNNSSAGLTALFKLPNKTVVEIITNLESLIQAVQSQQGCEVNNVLAEIKKIKAQNRDWVTKSYLKFENYSRGFLKHVIETNHCSDADLADFNGLKELVDD